MQDGLRSTDGYVVEDATAATIEPGHDRPNANAVDVVRAAEGRTGTLVVIADGFWFSRHSPIVDLAARYAIPTMYPLSQVRRGGWTNELWR
jgi:hypothetical protein